MTERFIHVPVAGAVLSGSEEGYGPVVLWAHGLTSSAHGQERVGGMFDWSPIVAAGFRLVRCDARGHGESTGSRDPGDYDFASLAEDMLAVADAVSPHAPVGVVGVSMGTATALHAAVLAPERFAALVLAAPPTAWELRARQGALYERFAAMVEEGGVGAFEAAVASAPVPASLVPVPGYPPPVDVSAEILPAVLRGVGSSDLPPRDVAARLTMPVLILPWAGDPAHPESVATDLGRLIPGAIRDPAADAAAISRWGERAAAWLRSVDDRHRQVD